MTLYNFFYICQGFKMKYFTKGQKSAILSTENIKKGYILAKKIKIYYGGKNICCISRTFAVDGTR